MKLSIVKIGGNIIDKPASLNQFLKDFSTIEGAKILVHGGGVLASELGKQLGVVPLMKNGRRVTDADTLKIVSMVYAGSINKEIVAALQALKVNAIGFSGADGNLMTAKKRAPEPIDFGFVGDIESVNTSLIQWLMDAGLCPVVSPIGHDGNGQLLNTNADTISAELAIALSDLFEVDLYYCFEKHGVLNDVKQENSVINALSFNQYETMKEKGSIADGMLPKLENAFKAKKVNVNVNVWIGHASRCLLATQGKAVGTQILDQH